MEKIKLESVADPYGDASTSSAVHTPTFVIRTPPFGCKRTETPSCSVTLRDPYVTQIGFSNFLQVFERYGAS